MTTRKTRAKPKPKTNPETNPLKRMALPLALVAIATSWFVFWPACSLVGPRPVAEEPPPPVHEIRELRASVADLTQAMDDLVKMNVRLADENRALKSMLVHSIKERMKIEKK